MQQATDTISSDKVSAIVADIGGTNTRVALTRGGEVLIDTVQRYRNADHSSIYEVLTDYLSDKDVRPDAACVDMAGPVFNGVGTLTNLNWQVCRDEIAACTGAHTVAVLNDLQAQGHSLAHVPAENLHTVRTGNASGDHAARLVLNVGTGLNAALVYRIDGQTLVPPSESGHVTLPVHTDADLRLMRYLAGDHGMAGCEEAISGRGIGKIYDWLHVEDGLPAPQAEIPTIVEAATAGTDALAVATMQTFIRIMAHWASDLALIQLPFGGIYFVGGVARHITPFLDPMGFEQHFLDKGRFSAFLAQFPVHVVDDDYAPLRGSASHLMDLLAQRG
ncbi:glucokinase [Pseudoprimorskyibacter insulae]|uniref:Glucokinase n=1 Tax=Pseudoprimorskyibacter insulae TaxID=1695997 RepID=A0A2R8AY42_9RHOB|nr:glucokinase [Pseudoprimorskyibacter insulae]SPF80784.1 Glucokinase [Pseudoprimorskyibacter insulae]